MCVCVSCQEDSPGKELPHQQSQAPLKETKLQDVAKGQAKEGGSKLRHRRYREQTARIRRLICE